VGAPPASAPWLRRPLYPHQLLLDDPGIRRGPTIAHQLLKGCDLAGSQVSGLDVLQHRLGQLLGALSLADLVRRLGKGLHDMEPVDRYPGAGQVFSNAAEERLRHGTDHLDDGYQGRSDAQQEWC
jgi:hypothetical protein